MEIMSPKNKKTKMTTTTTTSCAHDVIIDILSRVPANSLLRLRWACKYWFHLITRDTSFAKLHLHCSTSTSTIHRPHNLSVLISKPLNPLTPSIDYYSDDDGPIFLPCKIFQYYMDNFTTTIGSFSGRETNPILSGIFVRFQILGSCHGLILFSYDLREEEQETILCIWNPCTKEYKYLPKPPYGFDGYVSETFGVVNTRFGLGYDHNIEDYKVICNVKSYDESLHVEIHVQVYTLRTHTWKYIRSFTTNMSSGFFGNGVFVNGALHFIYTDYPKASRILSVDFEKEMYVEISNQPECLNNKAKSIQDLTIFEGSLCLTMRTGYTPMEAWVMKKDYNMNNNQECSWSKLYEIPHIDRIINHLLQPLRFTKDGEILLLDREEHLAEGLLLFDPKNNKITIHKVYKFHPIEKAATTVDALKIEVIYIESLVSLNSGTYIDEKGDYMHYWQENNYDYDRSCAVE